MSTQEEPRVYWRSACGRWVIVNQRDIPIGVTRTSNNTNLELTINKIELEIRNYGEPSWYTVMTGDMVFKGYQVYYAGVRTRDLPWLSQVSASPATPEAKTKTIPDYPKQCLLCGAPAYLGLNEVVHDPNYKTRVTVVKCPGRVFA